MDLKKHAALFGHGAFASMISQVVWLSAFFAGISTCAVGLTFPLQESAFVLPNACVADVDVFNTMYMFCFAALMSCVVQACSATLSILILESKKRVNKLPASSCRWCRLFALTGVFFCTISLACVICIVDCFIFVRMGRFACLGQAAKILVVVGDVVAALICVLIFMVCSYEAWYCN